MNTIYERALQCSVLLERWQEPATAGCDSTDDGDSARPRTVVSQIYSREDKTAAVQENEAARETQDLAELESHVFRFTLWANHNSAISRGRDSLDWRLRKSEVTYSVVLDLLEDLAQAISGMSVPEPPISNKV
jgi:hypothetical protein